jgi:hypothetical protein
LSDGLRDLSDRLERLATVSDDGRFSWRRLLGRLTRTPRSPQLKTVALTRLLDRIEFGYDSHFRPSGADRAARTVGAEVLRIQAEGIEPAADAYQAALRELTRNVARAERASFVHGRLPDGHLDRLWRLYQVAYRAGEWVVDRARRPSLRDLICPDARCTLAPLTTASSHGDPQPVHGVDALIAAARVETRSIGRQRRLLEAARQQLLDAGAALRLDAAAERARRVLLTRRIARIDRLEAAGVAPDVDLGYQVREAAERAELPRLCAALSALEESAFVAGDAELHRLASRASDALWGGAANRNRGKAREESLRASEDQMFGPPLRAAIDRGYAAGLHQLREMEAGRGSKPDDEIVFSKDYAAQWESFLTGKATEELLAAAVAADGCFQVGATISPGRASGETLRAELVSFPQEEMVLEPIGSVNDLAGAVIGDPRSVLLDLAAGRLLARRYVAWRPRGSGQRRLQNEVRVYVLDGSGSMLGPRSRMRDALLMAELSTLRVRLQDAHRLGEQVLYYRYFNEEVGETRRVASPEEALQAVDDVLGTLRYGGTEIEAALLASFEQIRLAAANDPDLARAQIVLVTDGEASIDEEAVRRAREDVGPIPVGVSIIALGTQNPELRKLAARQRARGERVFYQFIDDEELANIVERDTAGLPLHLPESAEKHPLSDELKAVLADIHRHLRRIDAEEIGHGVNIAGALADVGLSVVKGLDQRTRARIAAVENDRVLLDAAFLRAFPPVATPEPDAARPTIAAPPPDSPHVQEVVAALATVAEIVETFGAGSVERQADAIELLERLLAEAHVPPWEYAALVQERAPAVAAGLQSVHVAARFRRAS